MDSRILLFLDVYKRQELTLQTPESFFKRFRINMKIHHEVISIHPEYKTVSVKNLENGEIFEENYDKLILSPGAKPTQPRLPGVGMDKLFTLRTVEDTFRIKEYINKNHPVTKQTKLSATPLP